MSSHENEFVPIIASLIVTYFVCEIKHFLLFKKIFLLAYVS